MSAAVLSSLLVARLVTPLMAAYILLPSNKPHPEAAVPRWIEKNTPGCYL
ncbi:TPA: hypothetical protein RG728_000734 [Morganella morganii subsp. morganii]|nr:hypothetical protein [Morganella morganii]EKW8484286.1 hypothetical protein [Morganella morganii]HAT3623335.1 hypothetical protein [Morganella morganii]HCU0876797.1 hypothetical protein [Morganella morganii]HDU8691683.1 hypothetical protein [Morganella morganii subsp. morganii]